MWGEMRGQCQPVMAHVSGVGGPGLTYCHGDPQGLFGNVSAALEELCHRRLGQEFLAFPMHFCSENGFRAAFFSSLGLRNWEDLGVCFYTWDTQL